MAIRYRVTLTPTERAHLETLAPARRQTGSLRFRNARVLLCMDETSKQLVGEVTALMRAPGCTISIRSFKPFNALDQCTRPQPLIFTWR